MEKVSIFYLSRVLGLKVYDGAKKSIGRITDLIVDFDFIKPKLIAVAVRTNDGIKFIKYSNIELYEIKGKYYVNFTGNKFTTIKEENVLYLAKYVLDRQLVDIDGVKLVRVNDLRLAELTNGTYLVAVDVGFEGLLRRLGVATHLKAVLSLFNKSLPGKLLMWDEVETVDLGHSGIKLSKKYTKLSTLHPSDLADILEDLDINAQLALFNSLDEERAADVLEEMETDAQISVLESLTTEKAADVLELMPADEAADILDELEDDVAEEILLSMEKDSQEEIRELMGYAENTVGSIMSTDYMAFNENLTVNEVLAELRKNKPEPDEIYYLYIVDDKEKLIATLSLRDLIVSQQETMLKEIMDSDPVMVYDKDKIDDLAESVSKYNLLAIPVVDEQEVLVGMVAINDVVYSLLRAKRKRR